jgi:hypothetical protein
MPKGNWGHKHYEGTGFKQGHKLVAGKLFKKGEHHGKEFIKGQIPWSATHKGYTTSKKGKKYPEVSGSNHWNWKDGISLEYKKKNVRPKPNNCEICGDSGVICYDHNHSNGNFRGWVCTPCNIIMGYAKDNPEKLYKIIEYLKNNAS